MSKINGVKGTVAALGLGLGLTACGGGDGKTPSINHAPEIKNAPASFSMPEGANRTINNIICSDQDGDTTTMTAESSNPNLVVSYDAANLVLNLDASAMNVADQTNKNVDVTLACTDGNLTTYDITNVGVQDIENDAKINYSTNIPTEVSYKGTLTGSVTLSDADGQLPSSTYTFDLLDSNSNVVYTGTMEDNNSNGTYNFSVDLSSLNLIGTYSLQTESIDGPVGGENPDSTVVVSKDFEVKNYAPEWTQSTYDTGFTIRDDSDDPKTIMDLTSVSSDADRDNLTYTIVSVTPSLSGDEIAWNNSIYIDNGVLKVHNLLTNNPNINVTVSVVVQVSDGTSSSNTTVNFDFLNLN